MKLRIKGNSLRLRVTRPELAVLVEGGSVRETTRFGPGPADRLAYVLCVGDAADDAATGGTRGSALVATFRDNEVRVTLAPSAVRRWREPEQVGVEARQPVGGGSGGEFLHVLVEKDFACTDGPPGSEDPDAFPNPTAGRSC